MEYNITSSISILLFVLVAIAAGRLQISQNELRNHLINGFSTRRSYQDRNKALLSGAVPKEQKYIVDFFKNITRKCPAALIHNQTMDTVHWSTGTGDSNDRQIPGLNINLFLILPGFYWQTNKDKIMLVGAHYDSQLNTTGVDDNGSGMAAMLETARVIVNDKCTRDHTIMFVAFDLEEFGYVGSEHFVENYLVPEVLQRYNSEFEGAIILDTVMNYNGSANSQILPPGAEKVFPELYDMMRQNQFRGNFLALIGRDTDDNTLISMMQEALNGIQGSDQFLNVKVPLPFDGKPLNIYYSMVGNFMRSDHRNFWGARNTLYGLPAIQLSDTANFRGPMDQCYHQPCDNLNNMLTNDKLAFLGKTTQAIVFTVAKEIVVGGASGLQMSLAMCLFTTFLVCSF